MRRHPRGTLILAAVIVLVVAGLAGQALVRQGSHAVAASKPVPCVYTTHSIAGLNAFSSLVGRPISCAIVYNSSASNWDQLASPWFVTGNNSDYRWDRWATAERGRQLVIAETLTPANPPANWRALGAGGAYDQVFHTFADKLVAAGLGRSVIRLAAEGNGDWFVDNAGTTKQSQKQWAAYWARIARILHDTKGAHFVTDWTVSGGSPAIPLANYYPGDQAVDIVGLDQHDLALRPIGAEQPARWNSQNVGPNGVQTLLNFAGQHGKPLSLPEWGVDGVSILGAGDDAYYMNEIADLLASGRVAYDGYWEKAETDGVLSKNPKALAVYRDKVLPLSAPSGRLITAS